MVRRVVDFSLSACFDECTKTIYQRTGCKADLILGGLKRGAVGVAVKLRRGDPCTEVSRLRRD